jgi:hypothetical protein
MLEFVYLAVGVAIGVAIRPSYGYAKSRYIAWKSRKLPVVDENAVITCGACRCPILDQPITAVVLKDGGFKVYQCRQCSEKVTVPL